ncbi:FAD-binding and (Fe-S)-binding domain-containing protein [Lacinutrix salivirga]
MKTTDFSLTNELKLLSKTLLGELYYDSLMRSIYATDASVYRKLPLAVALPKTKADLKQLIHFANKHSIGLIPRAAGTSLAGQCIGNGIIVDSSKYFTKIISVDTINKTVTLQPGVVRDELNNYLEPFGLFFGPNTSTSNRCMIGGMVGNNSSGTTSIQYGVTRDKVLELHTILSDGSEAVFNEISKEEFFRKTKQKDLEGEIYTTIYNCLQSEGVQNEIISEFPKQEIHRRNTGYAIDALIQTQPFVASNNGFNMCNLLSGSEGTLAFTTQITLKLDVLPPKESIMVVAHFSTISSCLDAVTIAMKNDLHTCEMLDKTILDLTKHNKTQNENRQFIKADPEAILMCEIKANTITEAKQNTENLVNMLSRSQLSYANVILQGEHITKAMELRKAGLGLLGNLIGDKKSVACIEDTAVDLNDLSSYIAEFSTLMATYNQKAVYYAHAGAGELHLRPVLNLKKKEDVVLFRKITTDVAKLVKKYKGSFSGEHGDGIVRAEFIPLMIGENNYTILKQIKSVFDPKNTFNPGKIVNALPMDSNLRYQPDRVEPEIKTLLDFSASKGILREAEKCNGSGDCRKLPEFGGTMCPSYRATRNEKDTTRARANALREFLTHSNKDNKFNHSELKEVFSLCLSCKACASECPSSVDVATLKAEFEYQYQKANGFKLKDRFFANSTTYNKLASKVPKFSNFLFQNKWISRVIKNSISVHAKRSLPIITKPFNLKTSKLSTETSKEPYVKTVSLFIDEFTNHLESDIAYDAKYLLEILGYKVHVINNLESGRSYLSKGFLEEAKAIANKNISVLKDRISEDNVLVGIEPSALLTFKDEYLKLANDSTSAKHIATHTYLIEEFISNEIAIGNITANQFTQEAQTIKFHGHCHQKALSNQIHSFNVLNLPTNYKVTIIPSGCCGMAGSFGYEKGNYEISMQIGNQTLFPAVKKAPIQTIIAANGTSCRHQIKDGTQRIAKHPISILKNALK